MITHKLNIHEYPKFYLTQPSLKLKTQEWHCALKKNLIPLLGIHGIPVLFCRESLMSFSTSSFFMLYEDPAMFCNKPSTFVNPSFTCSKLSSCFSKSSPRRNDDVPAFLCRMNKAMSRVKCSSYRWIVSSNFSVPSLVNVAWSMYW